MKRCLGLSLLLVLAIALTAQASLQPVAIQLSLGDTVTFHDQTPNQSNGYGGGFDWTVASTVSTTDAAVGTGFQTFCAELGDDGNAYIYFGATYKIAQFITPVVGQLINPGDTDPRYGNPHTLVDTRGIYLFDLWSEGLIAKNPSNAAAVQVALWHSIGYTDSEIYSDGGIPVTPDLDSLISHLAAAWTSSWTTAPDDQVGVLQVAGSGSPGQDQIFFVDVDPSDNGLPHAPEPATIVIWGVGLGLAGAAALRRRKQPRGGWSDENRQAIFHIIEGRR
jgi:hypothetical protein